jgi:outer membrane lipoprotein-sorting protein
MKEMRKLLLLLVMCTLSFCTLAFAQTADELINKNIQAHGGLEKLKAIKSVKMTGKMSMEGGLEAPFIFQKKRPDKIRIEFTIQGLTGIQAYDGSTAWQLMPFMGSKDPQKMPEDDKKDIIEQADFDGPLVDYKAKGNTIEYVGKEDVEGTETHKLKVTLKNGDVRYLFLDPETGLELKATAMIKREGVEATVDSFFGDYKEVNGVIFPFAIEQKMAGKPGPQFSVQNVELDVDLADSMFVMPEAAAQTQPSQQE